jgi:hypothetical protein
MSTTFHMDLRVQDEGELFAAARKHAIEMDKLPPEQADELLRPQGEVDRQACLVMLLDPGSLPGCNIESSWID